MSIITLGTIEEEAALCRAAWAGCKIGDLALHCHHEILIEPLTEPAENRIAYILSDKSVSEQALRLRLFRPLAKKFISAEWDKARAERDKARAEWFKARAEWYKARAERDKARAERDKARAEWDKARAEWDKASDHSLVCQPGCPWNGRTIFTS